MHSQRLSAAAAAAVLLAAVAFTYAPMLACAGACFVDLPTVQGKFLGPYGLVDTRLNAWILSWVQHAAIHQPGNLFDANILYPAPGMLAGSEHLIGIAILTMPVRLFTSNAVLIYQAAIVISAFVLAASTCALVRRLTGSLWPGLAAGLVAIVMPWRIAALSHVQILSAHWLPLIWLLAIRILTGRRSPAERVAFVAVLALQLLSSFYVAYMVTASLAVLIAVMIAALRPPARDVVRLAALAGVAYLAFVGSALPYLARQDHGQLRSQIEYQQFLSIGVADALTVLMPRLETAWSWSWRGGLTFDIPFAVFVAALWALLVTVFNRLGADRLRPELKATVWMLWLCAVVAFVLMLGAELRVGNTSVKLPAYWASLLVPGYENLRSPLRWALIIGVVMPVLAGVGAWIAAARTVAALGTRGTTRRARTLVALACSTVLLVGVPWRRLPATEAWAGRPGSEATYAALAVLPAGPVLEIPWSMNPVVSVKRDTDYMLASTLHWKPLLNGFTAYLPPSFHLLRRIASGLPDADALTRLQRLTDLRWIVVHTGLLRPPGLAAWDELERTGRLRTAHAGDDARIYEVLPDADAGVWLEALCATGPGSTTATGVSRAPLDLPAPAGRLEVLESGGPWRTGPGQPRHPSRILITNSTDLVWPGLDPFYGGLVELIVTFSDPSGETVALGTYPLDVDVPASGSVATTVMVAPPRASGSYDVCFDLVQRNGPRFDPLPVSPVGREIELVTTARRVELPGPATHRISAGHDVGPPRCARAARAGSDRGH